MKKVITFMLVCCVMLIAGGGRVFSAYSVCNPLLGNVVYVDVSNSGSEDGSASNPWNTIQEGIDDATSGECIWVKEGTYTECIEYDSGISIYGGFPSDSFDWADRDPSENETILEGTSLCSYVVEIWSEDWCVLDGLIIEVNSRNYQVGVYVYDSDDVVIGSNKISKADTDLGKNAISVTSSEDVAVLGNQVEADMSGANVGWLNGIIYTYGDGTWKIEENVVKYCNTLTTSCGIVTNGMDSDGRIFQNRVENSSIGISCIKESFETGNVTVRDNRIGYCDYGVKQRFGWFDTQMTIVQHNWVCDSDEVGIEIEFPVLMESNAVWDSEVGIEDKHSSGTANIYENTVYNCDSHGFYLHPSSTTNLYNNISYSNDYGIKGTTTYVNSDYNCVHDSTTDNYDPNGFQGGDDINADPCFKWPPFNYCWYLNWRFYLRQQTVQTIPPYSPCVDAGNGRTPYGTTRSDHVIDSGTIDIGAHLPLPLN